MSNKNRLAKLKLMTTTGKVKPWLFLKSPVSEMPPQVTGMLNFCEEAAKGKIPFDRELIDKLKWLDLIYSSDSCTGYLDYCNQFMARFNEKY